jgi:hypothetical protein
VTDLNSTHNHFAGYLSQHYLMLNSNVIIGALASNFLAVTDLNSALCIVIIYCAWDHFEQRSIPNHEVNSQPNSNERWTCIW